MKYVLCKECEEKYRKNEVKPSINQTVYCYHTYLKLKEVKEDIKARSNEILLKRKNELKKRTSS